MKMVKRMEGIVLVLGLACSGVALAATHDTVSDGRDLHVNGQSASGSMLAIERTEIEGDVLMAKGQYVAAIDKYSQLDARQPRIMNKLGVALEHLGAMQKARTDYEEAIKLDPKFAEAYNNLATIFYAQHDGKKAERFYKKSIKLDPKNASAFKNLGTSYFIRKKYRKGAEAYQEALHLDPDVFERVGITVSPFDRELLAEMNYYLAELCAKNGQKEAAMRYLDKAVAAGFHDQRRMDHDAALASLREMPAFSDLMR